MSINKRVLAWLAALSLLVVLSACGGETPAEGTPTPEETTIAPATPVATVAAAAVTPSPTPVPTPEVTPPPEIVFTPTGGFAALAKDSDVVVLGMFKKLEGIVNMAPDPGNKLKVDTTVLPVDYKHDGKRAYVGEYQFVFEVEAVYKGSKLVKKGTSINVHLPYEYQMKDKPLNKEELFLMPEMDKQCVLFLSKDDDFAIFAPTVEPRLFYVRDDVLYIASADKAVETTWDNGAGVTGIALEALKKDLDVK